MKSSREYSWYNKITVGDWWTQGVRQDVSRYSIVMIINQKSDVKPDASKHGKAYNGSIFGIFYYYYYSSYPDVKICGLASQHT